MVAQNQDRAGKFGESVSVESVTTGGEGLELGSLCSEGAGFSWNDDSDEEEQEGKTGKDAVRVEGILRRVLQAPGEIPMKQI